MKVEITVATPVTEYHPRKEGYSSLTFEKYYPILIQLVEDDSCTKYYLDDIRAWADGNVSGIAGKERLIISTLAQATLSHLKRIEEQHGLASLPPGVQRIENRRDEIT